MARRVAIPLKSVSALSGRPEFLRVLFDAYLTAKAVQNRSGGVETEEFFA
jgi:hypothetical protein